MIEELERLYERVWREHDLEGALADLLRGEGRASGVPVELRFAQIWSFAGGRPRSMVFYGDVDEGRLAAGLEPPATGES